MFLEISQNPQENTCNFIKKETLTQVFCWECCESYKNIFSYRTPLVVTSELFTTRILQGQCVLSSVAAVMFRLVCFETFLFAAGFIFNSYKPNFVSALNKQYK